MCCKINQQHARLDDDRSGCFFQTYHIEEVKTRSPGILKAHHRPTGWQICCLVLMHLQSLFLFGPRWVAMPHGSRFCIPLARPSLETCVCCAVPCTETAETCTWCLQPPAPLLAAWDIFQLFSTSSVVYPTDLCAKINLCPLQGRER